MRVEAAETDSSEVVALRTRVLRPNFTDRSLHYEEDDYETTVHVAARADGDIIGVATFLFEPAPFASEGEVGTRLRGMAVAPDQQRRGIGRLLLERGYEVLQQRFPERPLIWCNARMSAVPFYEKLGFATRGDRFDIIGIGPHFVMWRAM